VFIRKFDTTKSITITDATAAFVRIVYYPLKTEDFLLMFVEGNTYPDEYIPYRQNITINDNDFKRTLLGMTYKEEYINLIDKTNYLIPSKSISTTTGLEIAGVSKASWYIPVEYGKLYVGNFFNYQLGACYDADKTYLCSINDGIGTLGVSPPQFYLKRSDVKFIRVTFLNAATPYIAEGTLLPTSIVANAIKTEVITEALRLDIKKDLEVNMPLNGLKWNVLGDSLTAAPGLTRSYHSILRDSENLFVRNYGISGSRIMVGAGGVAGADMVTRFATMDDDADIVTVWGGINDMNNSLPLGVMADRVDTTFYGALHLLISGLEKKYLNKRIGFITPLNYGSTGHIPYQNAIAEVCAYYSLPLLELYKNGMVNTVVTEVGAAYFYDGLHLNETGHDVIARKIKQFLLTL
jgi:lysophospholipase L1-like esterase